MDGVKTLPKKVISKVAPWDKLKKKLTQKDLDLLDSLKGRGKISTKLAIKVEKGKNDVEINQRFKRVELDQSVKRKIKYTVRNKEYETKIPLVWKTDIPSTRKTIQLYLGHKFHRAIHVTTTVPQPIPEAIELLKKYKNNFDKFEVWWVPNKLNVIVEPVEPDPILVGIKDNVCFELIRWIDETVEDGWWSYEGY